MKKDLFAQVPEFLAAFNNVLENGFFEEIQFHVGGKMTEGRIPSCSITAMGCVPSEKKYKADGCGAVIDPATIIASCRKLAGQKKIQDIIAKIETENWPLYDAEGQNVIGSKGKRTKLYILVMFKT